MQSPELFFPELSPIEKLYAQDNESESKEELILVISINIGDGRTDQIQIYEQDDPEQLAIEFTQKHQLGAKVKIVLEKEIEKYLNIAISRCLALNCLKANNKLKLEVSHSKAGTTFSEVSMKVNEKLINQTLSVPENHKFQKSLARQIPKPPNKPLPYQSISKLTANMPKKSHNSLLSSPELVKYSQARQNSIKNWPIAGLSSNFKEIFQTEKKTKPDNSERIMKKIKDKKYSEIFQVLSPNTNGTISVETIKKSKIPEKIQKILQPLLEELEEMKETLNYSEFCEAMDMLLKTISPGDKSVLMASEKKSAVRRDTSGFGTRGYNDKGMHYRNGSASSLLDKGSSRKKLN